MLDEKVKLMLKRAFDMALKIEGAQISYTPSAKTMHVFRFCDPTNFPAEYKFSYYGYYSSWCAPEDPESLDSLIKNLTDHIKNQK